MQSFKLYTELKNRDYVIRTISKRFDSYTVWYCDGMWQDKVENTLCIEVVVDDNLADRTNKRLDVIARAIARHNKQDAVLITQTEVKSRLVLAGQSPQRRKARWVA